MATVLPQKEIPSPVGFLPTILVVEDNFDDFFFLKRAFGQAGVCATIVRAEDGLRGKAYLEAALSSGRLPVCIVADLMMPVMDGFEFLQHVKGHPALRTIPTVILSTSANQKDITRAYQLGVNSYIIKPNKFESLVTITQALRDQWLGANVPPTSTPPMGPGA